MTNFIIDTSVVCVLYSRDSVLRSRVAELLLPLNDGRNFMVTPSTLGQLRYIAQLYRLCDTRSAAVEKFGAGLKFAERRCTLVEADARDGNAYAIVKSIVAYRRLNLTCPIPRWIELWEDGATTNKLNVNGEDLWTVALASARQATLVTCDEDIYSLAKETQLPIDCLYIDANDGTATKFERTNAT